MQSLGKKSLRRSGLAQFLAMLMAVTPVFAGQAAPVSQQSQPAPAAPPTPAPVALPTVESLKVVPLAGKDEVNDIERKLMAPLVVQVVDQNDRPVEGAEVVFRFPIQGPGAIFPGGKTSQTARTNGQGQAAAMNWMANDQVGRFEIHVTASYGNQVGQTTFSMSNANKVVQRVGSSGIKEKHGGWFSPTWVKVAVIGGGVAVAVPIILATRGGSTAATVPVAPPPPTVTITPGTPSVGGPH